MVYISLKRGPLLPSRDQDVPQFFGLRKEVKGMDRKSRYLTRAFELSYMLREYTGNQAILGRAVAQIIMNRETVIEIEVDVYDVELPVGRGILRGNKTGVEEAKSTGLIGEITFRIQDHAGLKDSP